MEVSAAVFGLMVTAVFGLLVSAVSCRCPSETLVVYKLQLDTFWQEQTFPKQFPLWRPSAQWSKTVGFSHGPGLSLFSPGQLVGEGVRQFVETADTEVLDRDTHNHTFLDAILAPPILKGVGSSWTYVFVDGNHSQVSLMTKLVPSPDWFIGLDSLQLCQEGTFLESFTTEAFPMDAGTDNGFTFTSPNWETEPRAEVFTITNTFPTHPAGSFHYPHLPKLPMLAKYSLKKLREYKMQKDFTIQAKGSAKYKYTVGPLDKKHDEDILEFVPMEEEKTRLSNEIPTLRPSKATVSLKSDLSKGFRSSTSVGGYHASTSTDQFLKKRYSSPLLAEAQTRIFSGNKKEASSSKADMYRQILASYAGSAPLHTRHAAKRKLRTTKKHKKPRHCRVTPWGSWGSCSKSCGIGESVRRRSVRQTARMGGRPCPTLTAYRWCGSARNCKTGYFRW